MKIYIYVLTEPDGTSIRYVGKSNEYRISKRLIEHCRMSQLKNHTHKNNWIKSLLNRNCRPQLKIIEECDESNFYEREKYWVQHYKSIGCDLVNGTVGGEGACRIHNRVISELQKKNISNTLKQRYKENPYMYTNCSNAGKKSRGVKRKFKFKQTSKEVGISFSYQNRKGVVCKWRAYIQTNKQPKHIGIFDTEQEAINARNKYLIENKIC